jgi:Zn-dependent protease
MPLSRIKVGRMKGITVQLDPTWFIIFALITFSLSRQLQEEYPSWGNITPWAVGISGSLLFFASVLFHELAHSLVAARTGIPVRAITLFIFGGVAQIDREANTPWTEFIIAAAGPASSLLLSLFFFGIWTIGRGQSEIVSALSGLLSGINLMLGLFNLIPGFPLDGGRLLRAITWGVTADYARATRVAVSIGKSVAYLFILIGVTTAIFGNLLNGLWIGFIGWFLLNAAQHSQVQAEWRNSLASVKAGDIMTRNCLRIPPDITLSSFVDDYLFHFGGHCFLVTRGDRLEGVLTLHELNAFPREQWAEARVAQAMVPLERLRWVGPGQNMMQILEHMDREKLSQVPVIELGQLVGVISREDILHLLQSRFQATA